MQLLRSCLHGGRGCRLKRFTAMGPVLLLTIVWLIDMSVSCSVWKGPHVLSCALPSVGLDVFKNARISCPRSRKANACSNTRNHRHYSAEWQAHRRTKDWKLFERKWSWNNWYTIPSRNVPGRTQCTHEKTFVMIADVPTESRTRHLPHKTLQHYRYANSLLIAICRL